MTAGVQPIADDERRARIEKARRLMRENKLGAIVMEGGSSLFYFTGTRWAAGDRLFAWVLPAAGEPAWFVPQADASACPRRHPQGADMRPGRRATIRTRRWRSSSRSAARVRPSGSRSGRASRCSKDCAQAAPSLELASADPVTIGCRVIKSPAEIALMQHANDVTIACYKAVLGTLREGMTNAELSANIDAGYRALGYRGDALVIFGKYTAFPHGSIQPQQLREGDVVLIDDGCTRGGLPIGHHAHHGIRQADRAPARGVEPGAQGAGCRAGGREGRARRANRWTPPRAR